MSIFDIYKDVPKEIQVAISESFGMFWFDPSACGNKIRMIVELIMDNQKVPKSQVKDGKRRSYVLHKRLELFKSTKSAEADLLMAIKWIGNSGSHTNGSLTKDDILDTCEILDHVTMKIYKKESKRINDMGKKINKLKKPSRNKRKI